MRHPVRNVFVGLAVFMVLGAVGMLLFLGRMGISPGDVIGHSFPESQTEKRNCPDDYQVAKKSYFEKQGKNQCGGFSSAYLLRVLGVEMTGEEAYTALGHKLKNGYVLPQAILDLLKGKGFSAKLYHGDLEQLKAQVGKGLPVIVLIGNALRWQHYVTVVGYDRENIYLYDTEKEPENTRGYNRVLSNAEFLSRWNNRLPMFERVYFAVE